MINIREKGKIPHSEWPNILAKYERGDTIAQIGRDYGCTAPAIRYIIKRSGRLKDRGSAERAAASRGLLRQQARAEAPAGGEVRDLRLTAAGQVVAVPSRRPVRGHVLGQELHQRVSGDVASFLAALDHLVLDGSLQSVADLQEATDQLMRSAARTRIELERFRSHGEISSPREKGRAKPGSA
jgi:hypothetical protein